MADEQQSELIERQAGDTQEEHPSTEQTGDQSSDTEKHHDTADPWWTGELAETGASPHDAPRKADSEDEESRFDPLLDAIAAQRGNPVPPPQRTSPLEPVADFRVPETDTGQPWYIAGVLGALTAVGIIGLAIVTTLVAAIPTLGLATLLSPLIGGLVAGGTTTQSDHHRALAGVMAIVLLMLVAAGASVVFDAISIIPVLLALLPLGIVIGIIAGTAGGALAEE